MLYRPPKTKKYILIGASAIALAVLAVVIAPLSYRQKTSQTPASNLSSQEKAKQAKIQKEFENFFNSGNCRGRGLLYQSA
jgi:cytochrome c-type biogenesis protein CcmH/NrfF